MRVLHLLKTGAGAAWALRQMRELVASGVEVHLAVPPGPLVPAHRAAGVQVHEVDLGLPVSRPHRIPGVLARCRALVDAVKPDLIHSHFVATTLTMRLALGKGHPVPRLFQVPGPLHLEHAFFRFLDLSSAGDRDYWMGSCRWTQQRYLAAGIPPSRVFLSQYGVDPAIFEPRPAGKLRRELGLAPSVPLVGMVAFFYAPKLYLGQSRGIKGHEDLIDAVAACLPDMPDLRCVVIGGPWGKASRYERRVQRYARRCCGDAVLFLGTRSDVPDLYPDLDVAVTPSLSENLGAPAESLALGVPTVATNVGGLPDIVVDGQTGWLVPPRDPERLAEAILAALRDRSAAKARAAEGHKLALQLLDVRVTARAVRECYEGILQRR